MAASIYESVCETALEEEYPIIEFNYNDNGLDTPACDENGIYGKPAPDFEGIAQYCLEYDFISTLYHSCAIIRKQIGMDHHRQIF